MHAGRLRNKVTIEAPTRSTTTGGQPTVTWGTHSRVWANVTTESMAERVKAARPEARTKWRVELRYDKRVNETMRVQHDGHTLNINGVIYDRVKRWMWLDCFEEV